MTNPHLVDGEYNTSGTVTRLEQDFITVSLSEDIRYDDYRFPAGTGIALPMDQTIADAIQQEGIQVGDTVDVRYLYGSEALADQEGLPCLGPCVLRRWRLAPAPRPPFPFVRRMVPLLPPHPPLLPPPAPHGHVNLGGSDGTNPPRPSPPPFCPKEGVLTPSPPPAPRGAAPSTAARRPSVSWTPSPSKPSQVRTMDRTSPSVFSMGTRERGGALFQDPAQSWQYVIYVARKDLKPPAPSLGWMESGRRTGKI